MKTKEEIDELEQENKLNRKAYEGSRSKLSIARDLFQQAEEINDMAAFIFDHLYEIERKKGVDMVNVKDICEAIYLYREKRLSVTF